jgi:hypothetical protein
MRLTGNSFMPGVSSGLHVLFSELTPSGVTKFVVIYFAQRKGTSMPGRGSSNGDVRFGVFELDVQVASCSRRAARSNFNSNPSNCCSFSWSGPGRW